MLDLVDVLPIVEPGATHGLLVRPKPERMHEVETSANREREPARVPRVRCDLGLDEHEVESRLHARGPPPGYLSAVAGAVVVNNNRLLGNRCLS